MTVKKSTWGFEWKLLGVLLVLLLTPSSAYAQAPPDSKECLGYIYTESERHFFLVQTNASVFGTDLKIIHNCDQASLVIDGNQTASSASNFSYVITQGLHSVELILDNQTMSFENVSFYPDRLQWEFEYIELTEDGETYISISESDFQVNWAVAFSIVIVWVLSVYVYWQLINSYVDRNFIEEVQQ